MTSSFGHESIERMEEVWSIFHIFEQVFCTEIGTNRAQASRFHVSKSPWIVPTFQSSEKVYVRIRILEEALTQKNT